MQLTMDDRRNFPQRVSSRLELFMKYSCPVPFDPYEDVYRASFTKTGWLAMRYLREQEKGGKDLLIGNSQFSLYFDPSNHAGYRSDCLHVTFKFPKSVGAMPTREVDMHTLPPELQNRIRAWVKKVNYFRSLRMELWRRIQGMLGNAQHSRQRDLDDRVNTPGQIIRLWPELQPYFPPEWKDAVRNASSRSPLRGCVSLNYEDMILGRHKSSVTAQEFRCEAPGCDPDVKRKWEQLNEVLRLMALATDVENIRDYPDVRGPAHIEP